MNRMLSRVRIVLVEPAGPLNLGSVARVMKNMGLSQLVLVNPQCQPSDDDARLMAVHAADVLESARQVATLPEALADCHRAVATTSRDRDMLDDPLEHPHQVLPWLLGLDKPDDESVEAALIFGPEDRGLSNHELSSAQRFLKIPTSPIYPSLNLAQAVAICCHELYQVALAVESETRVPSASPRVGYGAVPPGQRRSDASVLPAQWGDQGADSSTFDSSPSDASIRDLEGFYHHLEDVLLHIGYIYPHTAESRINKFRRLFNRAGLTTAEVSMLRGILRQVEWAVNTASKTAPDKRVEDD